MERYSQFIREKRYLQNVSPATVSWYEHARRWLPNEQPTQEELNDMVVRMREAGLKETGANAAIRAINVYLHWLSNPRGKCGPGCPHPHIRQMKEPVFIPVTFNADQVKKFVGWRPQGFYDRRLHLMVLILLDTGARISEVLSLHVCDVDLDDLLMTLAGKGRKQRRVPVSLELRRSIYKHIAEFKKRPADHLLSSAGGRSLGRNVCLRDVKRLCGRLSFEPPPRTLHAFRHTFAVNYLRRGGSVFHLQKILGHTSLEMSRRYASLSTEDLSAIHERISLLGG